MHEWIYFFNLLCLCIVKLMLMWFPSPPPLPSCINKGILILKKPAWSSLNDLNLPQTYSVDIVHEVFDYARIYRNVPMYSWTVFSVTYILNSQVCYTMLATATRTTETVSWFLLMLQIPTDLQTVCVCRTSSN